MSRRRPEREMRSEENDRFSRSISAPMSAGSAERILACMWTGKPRSRPVRRWSEQLAAFAPPAQTTNRAIAPRLGPNCDRFGRASAINQSSCPVVEKLLVGRRSDCRELVFRHCADHRVAVALLDPIQRPRAVLVIAPEPGLLAL